MEVKFTAYMDVDKNSFNNLKKLEHHAEWLLDLNSWPEIKSVYGVTVDKDAKFDETDEEIYWRVQLKRWTEEAKLQYENYCQTYDAIDLKEEDFKKLADLFNKYHDYEQADNDVWQNIIHDYVNDNE